MLDFHGATFAQFNHNKTLGRVGVGGFVVGIGVGFNLAVLFVSLYTYLAAGFYSGAMVRTTMRAKRVVVYNAWRCNEDALCVVLVCVFCVINAGRRCTGRCTACC